SPETAEPGDEIKISGKNFGESQANGVVSFGEDMPAKIFSWSDTRITCAVPGQLTSGTYKVSIQNSEGEQSNEVSYDVQAAPEVIIEENIEPEEEPEEKKEESSDEDGETGRSDDTQSCQTAMISYAKSNSEPGIEFSFVSFWMNDEQTEAEAILMGVWTSGPNKGQELEQAGITATKQGGNWVVTDFGTGIELEHL
ncbi:MAG: IPT/TIG domain-containing protein, partial [Actinobacteria bacterium]|nr:IPT/TIG domain-containing protein [Actinomycetota bacterium]